MFSKSLVRRWFYISIIVLAIFTRFIKLDWGNGYYFQPDENNMASALSQLSTTSLNPHFFAYGQFPLYLGFIALRIVNLPNTFTNSIIALRFISAIYSLLFLLFFHKLAKLLFPKYSTAPLILLLISSPGLIQIAHFGTTEALLCLIFTINIYFSLKIIKQPKFIYFVLIGLVTGVGFASKISSLVFFAPLIFSSLFIFFKSPHKPLLFFGSLFSLVISLVFGILLSPYNLIEYSNFVSAMKYETTVAIGATPVFYTNQFLDTPSYLFQLVKVFPYTSGMLIYFFGFVGLSLLFIKFRHQTVFQKKSWLVIILSVILYFGYFGQLYVKWTRFMSPIFFIFPLLTAFFYYTLKNKILKNLLLFLLVFTNLYFLKLYLVPDIRVEATNWFSENLPENTPILSEAGNVVNLPFGPKPLDVFNFDFYNLDNNPSLPSELIRQLEKSEYILIPSRRIFKNQTGRNFPVSTRYYQLLASGDLGFTQIKTFSRQYELFLNSENAEETWSVFDQPTIRLFQKTTPHTVEEYTKMLIPDNQNS
ncbi:glycosyltransferase family 39 protein [Candidatus Shapirobacteria bacterium]|nr:glycosyltransferase family 39 protein [Candidatus Shapirobacteria bacterium]